MKKTFEIIDMTLCFIAGGVFGIVAFTVWVTYA